MKTDFCYHTHTSRCGHAYGTDEEYVLKAIENGFKVIGFSDHIFLPGITQVGMRGEYFLLDEYLNSIKSLKEKYKDKIEIKIGFEAEYIPAFENYYRSLLDNNIVQYLLLGQHIYLEDGGPQWYFFNGGNKEQITRYANDLIKGIETKIFLYVCHPDAFMHSRPIWDDFAKDISYKICRAAKENDIPLELNLGASRWTPFKMVDGVMCYGYPYLKFWQIAKELGVKVTIGIDAHAPNDFDVKTIGYIYDIIEKLDLNVINRFNF